MRLICEDIMEMEDCLSHVVQEILGPSSGRLLSRAAAMTYRFRVVLQTAELQPNRHHHNQSTSRLRVSHTFIHRLIHVR